MMLVLGFPTLLLLAGISFMAFELHNAPEGYEDARGFHYLWKNYDPQASDIACIWAGRNEEPVVLHGALHAAA